MGTRVLNNPLGHIIILDTPMVPSNQGSQSALQTSTTLPLLFLILLLLIYFSILQLRNLRHRKKEFYFAVIVLKKLWGKTGIQFWDLWVWERLSVVLMVVILALLGCRTTWAHHTNISFKRICELILFISQCGLSLIFTSSSSLPWYISALASSRGPSDSE